MKIRPFCLQEKNTYVCAVRFLSDSDMLNTITLQIANGFRKLPFGFGDA